MVTTMYNNLINRSLFVMFAVQKLLSYFCYTQLVSFEKKTSRQVNFQLPMLTSAHQVQTPFL